MKEPILLDISGRISMESEEMNQIPASGIYINQKDESRESHLKDAIIDSDFPEIVHFEVVRDIENREAFDGLKSMISRLEKASEDDIETDFEIYDELLSNHEFSLVLHVRVEDKRVAEVYLTIDNRKSVIDLMNDSDGLADVIGDPIDDEFDFNSGDREVSAELNDKFNKYIENEDCVNARSLPLSILDSYMNAYDSEDWINTALKETIDGDPYWPIHVEH